MNSLKGLSNEFICMMIMTKISPDTLRLAIIVGVVLPGVGHIYLGQIKRGIYVVGLFIFIGIFSAALVPYIQNYLTTAYIIPGSRHTTPEEQQQIIQQATTITTLSTTIVSIMPLIVWIWAIRDLRRIIKKNDWGPIDKLEPPELQVKPVNSHDGKFCQNCGNYVDKNSPTCNKCGFKF
jgi:hypothetical protein